MQPDRKTYNIGKAGIVPHTHMKRHLISAGITFVSATAVIIIPQLLDPSWNFQDKAALLTLLMLGVRAGVKALWEKFGPEMQSAS